MKLEEFKGKVLARPLAASDGSHSHRLWRIGENIEDHALPKGRDDRLLHLMSRVGNMTRPLAKDIRSGFTSAEDAAVILDQLADLGDICFREWMK